jgi:NAD+ diphosphatase
VQFPRTDPAVIMRVTHGDKILMARQAVWAQGMHSVLAGFVEPGESLEDAVAREVYEEVGLRLTRIKYFSSQPWPFPSSLMLGFSAEATSADFKLDHDELESARWMTRPELLNSPEDATFKLPRKDSISRRLIEDWLRLKF